MGRNRCFDIHICFVLCIAFNVFVINRRCIIPCCRLRFSLLLSVILVAVVFFL